MPYAMVVSAKSRYAHRKRCDAGTPASSRHQWRSSRERNVHPLAQISSCPCQCKRRLRTELLTPGCTSSTHRAPLNDSDQPAFDFNAADPAAAYQAVYGELKRVARSQLRSQSNLTDLPATVLVHESYARMARLGSKLSREAFFSYAARAMRSVVIDYVRARKTDKRDGIDVNLTLAGEVAAPALDNDRVLAVDRALHDLKEIDQRAHDLVELRYFAGFTLEECAGQLGISMATATRDWQKARAFLADVLEPGAR